MIVNGQPMHVMIVCILTGLLESSVAAALSRAGPVDVIPAPYTLYNTS